FPRHLRYQRNTHKVLERDHLMLDAERWREAALGRTPSARPLAALEVRLAAARTAMTRTRLAALVTLSGRLALARARTPAEPLAIAMRSRRPHEVIQADALDGRCFRCLLRGSHLLGLPPAAFDGRHLNEVSYELDLSAQTRRDLL